MKVVRMLFIYEAFFPAVSDLACLETLVVFVLEGMAFFATLAFLVTGGMADFTSRLVITGEMIFVMLLIWPKISNVTKPCRPNQQRCLKSWAKLELTGIGPFGHVTFKRQSLEKLAGSHGENLM